MSRGTGNKRPKDSSIFATFKIEQDEEEDREMHLRDLQPPKMPIQSCALFYSTNKGEFANELMPAMNRSDEFRRSFDRRTTRCRSPSPNKPIGRRDERPPKSARPKRVPNRSRSIETRRKLDQGLKMWTDGAVSSPSSAPASSCGCEEDLRQWVELRRRLSSFDGKDDIRRGYLRTAEHSASALSDKSCHLITSLKNRVNMGGYTGSGSPRRHNMEYASGSLGRKPRVPPKPCPSQIALAEAIKTLNTLAESLHKETKCLRGEISELYDKFEEDDQTAVTKDEQQQRQLSELSRYVKILEYRLLKAQKLDEQSSVDVEAHLNLQNEVERLEMRARADQEENRELYLQILQLRTNERALKEDNKRLLNQLDHLSLHGRSVSPDREESLIAPEYRSETDKANGLLQAEIEVLKESLQEMNKLNKDLKDKLLFYQQSRSSTSEEPILISQLRQLEQDNEDLKTKLDYLQTTDTEFLEEEMLVLQSTVKELEIENDRLKRLSNPDLTDLQPLQDELQKLKTENANLRSGVQNKIHLKSAIRSMLTDQTLRRSSSSERSFIARRGIFELLPVLSVREEVFRVQRLSNKLLSALRKQQSDIPLSAISAEARALAAETALLVKKYGVLEEQVQTLIKELKQVQIAPSHVSTAANEINEDEFIV